MELASSPSSANASPFRLNTIPLTGATLAILSFVVSLTGAEAGGLKELPRATPFTIELVQSVPVETDLGEPSVRTAEAVWVELISNARSTLDIEQMYVQNEAGRPLEPVMQALTAAGNRGVRIRFILSQQMSKNDLATSTRLAAIPNLTLSLIDLGKVTGGIQHAKVFIADGETSFVGSQNFDWKALNEIHELGLLIHSKNVASRLEAIFATDLAIAKSGVAPPATHRVIAPTETTSGLAMTASPGKLNPVNVPATIDSLTALIASAKKHIQIQVMEYSTYTYGNPNARWNVLDDALRAAAVRGVEIDFIVSHWNQTKPEIESIQALATVPGFHVKICELPLAREGVIPYARVIHSKYMLVDDSTLWLGTSNWIDSYFTNTRDVDFIVKDRKTVASASNIFDRVWSAPYTTPVDPNRAYPAPRK